MDHIALDFFQRLKLHIGSILEIESQLIFFNFGAPLLSMLTEVGLQSMMQNVCCGVGSTNSLSPVSSDLSLDLFTHSQGALFKHAVVQQKITVLLGIDNGKDHAVGDEFAGIPHLPARFSVEG